MRAFLAVRIWPVHTRPLHLRRAHAAEDCPDTHVHESREALQGQQQHAEGRRHGKEHLLHSAPAGGPAHGRAASPRQEYHEELQQNVRSRPEGRPPLAPTQRQGLVPVLLFPMIFSSVFVFDISTSLQNT